MTELRRRSILPETLPGESGAIPELSRSRKKALRFPVGSRGEKKFKPTGSGREPSRCALHESRIMNIFSGLIRFTFLGLILLTGFSPAADELRVISLSPSLTELVFQLGKGQTLIGRSSVCDYPAEAAALPVAGNFADPDLERVLKLKPDLIITNDLMRPGSEKALRLAGIRLIRMQCRNMTEYLRWTEELGRRLNCPEAAAGEISRIKSRMKRFRNPAGKNTLKPKVCWVIWDSPLMIAGGGSFPESVIQYAGGINLAQGVREEYFKASKDWLLKNQPDILVWTCSRPLNREDRFWKSLKAVRRGRVVHAPDSALLLRPGPRLPEGIAWLKREMEKFR